MSIKIKDGRKELWQWDTERFLTVSDDVDFVHFSNLQYGKAFTSEVVNGEARIPDELLQVNGQLYSYIFKGSVENGYTEYSEQFEIKKKPKPVDYVFTPTEYITIEDLDKRVKKLEKQGGGGGQSGFSPIVEILPITGGHRVIITDINGNHEFDVFDGQKGEKGDKGDKPVKGVDYFTPEDVDKIAEEASKKVEIPEIGTNDYTQLKNKPKINGVELNGDLTPEQLGIVMSGGDWELVKSFTIEEDVQAATIILDKPISGEILIHTNVVPANSNSGNGAFKIYFNNAYNNESYTCNNGVFKDTAVFNFLYRKYQDGFFSPIFFGNRYGDTAFSMQERADFSKNLKINSITLHAYSTAAILGIGTETRVYQKGGNKS